MIQLDVFNDDEKQYLNALVKGRDREKVSRQDILKAVAFARDVADGTDTMILDLIDGVYSKVNNLSDSEWEDLRRLFPFPVVITSTDLMDVPADEEDDFAETLAKEFNGEIIKISAENSSSVDLLEGLERKEE